MADTTNSGGTYLANMLLATQNGNQTFSGTNTFTGTVKYSGTVNVTGSWNVYGSQPTVYFHYGNAESATSRIWDHDGQHLAVSASPSASSSTTDTFIATTGWVNNASLSSNVVHKTDTETITGTKTFSTVSATTASASTMTVSGTLNIPGGKIWIA